VFNEDSVLLLTPDLVGPTVTKNSGIIGASVDLSLKHLDHVRPSTLLFHLTQRLLYTKWRDPGEAPKLHLFGQLKRVTKLWLDGQSAGAAPIRRAHVSELADMA
jgi:type III restriction enzyme